MELTPLLLDRSINDEKNTHRQADVFDGKYGYACFLA
jgi:hypothetical protein